MTVPSIDVCSGLPESRRFGTGRLMASVFTVVFPVASRRFGTCLEASGPSHPGHHAAGPAHGTLRPLAGVASGRLANHHHVAFLEAILPYFGEGEIRHAGLDAHRLELLGA